MGVYMTTHVMSRITAVIGLFFLAAAGYFAVRAHRAQSVDLQPLRLPVSLAVGTIQTPPIRADFNKDYEISIEVPLQHDPDPQRTKCLLGAEINSNRCPSIPSLLDFSWNVLEGEHIVAHGDSATYLGATWEPGIMIERIIGNFHAKKGSWYVLALQVRRDASQLNSTGPEIVVQLPHGYWEDNAMGVGFLKIRASMLGLIGIFILGIFFRLMWTGSKTPR